MAQSMNPMQIIAMIKNGQNPQQLVLSMLENQMGGTPMGTLKSLLVIYLNQEEWILTKNLIVLSLKWDLNK